MVGGEVLETLGEKKCDVRLFNITSATPLEGEKCFEILPKEPIELSVIRSIKRSLPVGYDTVIFRDIKGTVAVDFIKPEEEDEDE